MVSPPQRGPLAVETFLYAVVAVMQLMARGMSSAAAESVFFPSVALPALAPFPSTAGELCQEDSRTYLADLGNLTLWAAQMFDSWGKLPTGVLYGSTYEMGNFDQCIEITTFLNSLSGNRTVRGEYCLARVDIIPEESLGPNNLWTKVQEALEDRSAISRALLHWGVCVPDSCNAEDVQNHLSLALQPLASFLTLNQAKKTLPNFSVTVEPSMCHSKSDVEDKFAMSGGTMAMCAIIGTCLTLVVVGTSFDLLTSRKTDSTGNPLTKRGLASRIVLCFSAVTNSRRLFTSSEVEGEPFAFISGMKVWTMLLVILGHRFIFNTAYPILNMQFVENLYRRTDLLVMMGSTVIVDTFLVITGCLLVYLYLTDIQKHPNTCPIIYLYLHRFLRLTPIYMLVVGFYSSLLIYLGDGPLWKQVVGAEASFCSENWWTNLLYVNTFINSEKMCMIQSWYMAVDMHLFIIGVPIAHLLYKKPFIGRAVLALFTVLSIIIPFLVTLWRHLDPILLTYIRTLKSLRTNPNFQESYTQTHMRAIPYFIGMIVGNLIFEARKRGYKFVTHMEKQTSLVLASASGIAAILGSVVFLHPDHEYDPLAAAFFSSVHHLTWSLCMGTLIFAEATGCYRFYHKFLTWNSLVPFSRLTYGAFLVHAGIQLYSINTRRSPETATTFELVGQVMFDAICSYFLAYIISMVFEAPLLKLEKILVESLINKKSRSSCLNEAPMQDLQVPFPAEGSSNSARSREPSGKADDTTVENNMADIEEMAGSFHVIS